MANIVIVSSRCYLLCEAINHISMDIHGDMWDDEGEIVYKDSSKKRKAKKPKTSKKTAARLQEERLEKLENTFYQITINFVPVGGSAILGNSRGGDVRQVQIMVRGHSKAVGLYQEIVMQIREQLPDQMFLDKLVENLLGTSEVAK